MTASVRLLSVLPEELPAAIERLQADAKDQKRAMVGLQNDLARYRADELAAGAEEVGPAACRLVARAVDADANGLKTLATAIAAKPASLSCSCPRRRRRSSSSRVRLTSASQRSSCSRR